MRFIFTFILIGLLKFTPGFSQSKGLHFSIDNEGHSAPIRKILINDKKNEVLTISEDKSICFWNKNTFELIEQIHFDYYHGRFGTFYDACFIADTNFVAVAGQSDNDSTNSIKIINLNTRKIATSVATSIKIVHNLYYSSQYNLLFVGGNNLLEIIQIDNTLNYKTTLTTTLPCDIANICSNDEGMFYLACETGLYSASLKDLQNGKLSKLRHHYGGVNALIYNKIEKKLYSGGNDFSVNRYNLDGKFEKQILKTKSPISSLNVSENGEILFIGEENTGKMHLFSSKIGKRISTNQHVDNTIYSAAFFKNDKGMNAIYSGGSNHELDVINPHSGEIMKELGGNSTILSSITFEDNKLFFTEKKDNDEYNEYFDFALFKPMHLKNAKPFNSDNVGKLKSPYSLQIMQVTIDVAPSYGRILSWTNDENNIFIGTDFHLLEYNRSGELVNVFNQHTRGIRSLCMAKTDLATYLISSGEDEIINFWKKEGNLARKPFLQMYINHEREWIIWSPEGYFNSSENGAKLVGFQNGENMHSHKFLKLDQLFDILYTPENVSTALKTGNSIKAIKEAKDERIVDFSTIKGASYVTIDDFYSLKNKNGKDLLIYPTPVNNGYQTAENQLTIEITAVDGGAGIKEISALRDGKLVALDKNIGKSKINDQIKKTYTIDLLPGQNKIEFFAENFQKRNSLKMSLDIECTGEIKAVSNLKVIVIGINKYKNSLYNLNYAKDDAAAFAQKIREVGNDIFNEVTIHELYDNNATKSKILESFQSIADESTPNDVFIFYFAGHGSIDSKDPEAQYFLIPHELVQIHQEKDVLTKQAFSAEDLKEAISNISAQKQLILLDACHSGGAVKSFSSRGAAETKAIYQLARSSGIVLISASGTEQYATEFKTLGHGVFTYTLLEGLSGKADGSGGDKKITVNELKAFMEDQVPVNSQKHGGTAQYPTGFSTGQDFPIGVVK